jgi:hypothetical protein
MFIKKIHTLKHPFEEYSRAVTALAFNYPYQSRSSAEMNLFKDLLAQPMLAFTFSGILVFAGYLCWRYMFVSFPLLLKNYFEHQASDERIEERYAQVAEKVACIAKVQSPVSLSLLFFSDGMFSAATHVRMKPVKYALWIFLMIGAITFFTALGTTGLAPLLTFWGFIGGIVAGTLLFFMGWLPFIVLFPFVWLLQRLSHKAGSAIVGIMYFSLWLFGLYAMGMLYTQSIYPGIVAHEIPEIIASPAIGFVQGDFYESFGAFLAQFGSLLPILVWCACFAICCVLWISARMNLMPVIIKKFGEATSTHGKRNELCQLVDFAFKSETYVMIVFRIAKQTMSIFF